MLFRSVENLSGSVAGFTYYGLTGQISLVSTGGFTGTIYAPQANLTVGGSDDAVFEFIGASITKSVVIAGDARFHFDENLKRIGPAR